VPATGRAKGCLFQEHLTSRALTDVKRWHKINFIHLFCMIPGRYIHFLLVRLDRYHGTKKEKMACFSKLPTLFGGNFLLRKQYSIIFFVTALCVEEHLRSGAFPKINGCCPTS
jgi:hypothetical protein